MIRPADASETAEAWRAALKQKGPLRWYDRQKLGFRDRAKYPRRRELRRVLTCSSISGRRSRGRASRWLEVALISRPSRAHGRRGSRPRGEHASHEFCSTDAAYQQSVLPSGVKRVSIEAGHPMSWQRWVGADGVALVSIASEHLHLQGDLEHSASPSQSSSILRRN